MAAFTPTLATRWETAKTEFTAITNQDKPREKLAGAIKTTHTGLSKSLKECDTAADDAKKAQEKIGKRQTSPDKAQKKLTTYKDKHKQFQTAVRNYLTVLNGAITEEQGLKKNQKSPWERGLKYLKKQLESLDFIIARHVASVAQDLDGTTRNLSAADKQAELWSESMNSAIKAGLAAAAKVKMLAAGAGKTITPGDVVKAYNGALPGVAGKDIVTELKNGAKVQGLTPTPDQSKRRMEPWSDNTTHKLPNTASAADVMKKVKDFTGGVKFTLQWYETVKNSVLRAQT
jgi:hypothetical protein